MRGSKLYVGNIGYNVAKDELETLFSEHGQVKDIRIIEGKGFGFVEMSSSAEAEKARQGGPTIPYCLLGQYLPYWSG